MFCSLLIDFHFILSGAVVKGGHLVFFSRFFSVATCLSQLRFSNLATSAAVAHMAFCQNGHSRSVGLESVAAMRICCVRRRREAVTELYLVAFRFIAFIKFLNRCPFPPICFSCALRRPSAPQGFSSSAHWAFYSP